MKTVTTALAAWLIGTGAALAQTPATPVVATRGDAHFTLGWQNVKNDQPQDHYDDWINNIVHGGAGIGWYWNDHLKTQVDIGAGSRGRQFSHRQVTVDNITTGLSYETRLQQTSVAIGQHYQFFRNQWFHPHVGLGVDIARESRIVHLQPLYVFDITGRTTRQISPARVEGPDARIVVRPFGELGLKAYMTRRAFFTSDMRLMVRGGIDQALFRVGFGFDF
jgi:hypothetical protein